MKLTPKKIIQTLEEHRDGIKKFAVRRIGLFGSSLKGEQKKCSDLDFLVSFKEPTFDNYMDLKIYLEKVFHKKVDLVDDGCLKPALSYVNKEAVYVTGI